MVTRVAVGAIGIVSVISAMMVTIAAAVLATKNTTSYVLFTPNILFLFSYWRTIYILLHNYYQRENYNTWLVSILLALLLNYENFRWQNREK